MVKSNDKKKVINFKKPQTEEGNEALIKIANKIQVINELTDDGIISPKERLRIIKKLVR
jgi:hypothetical protein